MLITFSQFNHKALKFLILILISSNLTINAQQQSPVIEVINIKDSTIIDEFLIGYTSRDMRAQLGFPQEYESTFGVSWLDGWPLYKYKSSPYTERSTCQAFRKHFETYTVWIRENSSTGPPVTSWLQLDADMNVIKNLPIDADNHGIGIDINGNILYSEKEFSIQSFPQFGWLDTMTVTGNTKLYDPVTGTDRMLLRFLDHYTTDLVLPENKTQGNVQGVFDWTHNNENRVTRNNDYIITDRHLGARVLRGDSVLFWIGINDSLASANSINVLSKSGPGDYELKLSHNGREVPTGVFSENEHPDSLYLSFFDNGTAERGYSRAIVYGVDMINQSHGIVFEHQFPYAPFAGSVEFLPQRRGVYLVNIPVTPDSFFVWSQTQQIDSILHHIDEFGNLLYLMDLSGDTLASFRSSHGNVIYQAELFEQSEVFEYWPEIECNGTGDDYFLSSDTAVDSVKWYRDGETFLNNGSSTQVSGGIYYFTFDHGITTGYSRPYNTIDCLINGDNEIVKTDSHFSVYPNPTRSDIHIKFDEEAIFVSKYIEIYDGYGRLVKRESLSDKHVDLSGIGRGIFFFKIYTDEGFFGEGRFFKME